MIPVFFYLFWISMMAKSDTVRDVYWEERQLTFGSQNHELDHNENFSFDDEWIVYDTRPDPDGIAKNAKIEKVHVKTGELHIIYEAPTPSEFGPGVGAVSYHPSECKVIFIHGLPNADASRPYAGHRRTGVIIDESQPGKVGFMDSRDIYPPFTPGALRGGTHRHQWSTDGEWMGFTYNDALMVDLEEKTGRKHDLRTVGVAKIKGPDVNIQPDEEAENIQGEWFSALVVKVVPDPVPGSDEISRAYGDWWVGSHGYLKEPGIHQRARAYMGDLLTSDGKAITEVFVVDIPDELHQEGDLGPLEGTAYTMPMPPKGAVSRRLTYTENRRFPGVATTPRHWLSSASDGSFISYLARDDNGMVQVFLISPLGGEPIQATFHSSPVQSMVRWHPQNGEFTYVCDNSLFMVSLAGEDEIKEPVRLTARSDEQPFAHCFSRKGDKIAFNRYVEKEGKRFIQVFLAESP
jgi:hypothetical protein